MLTTRSIVTTVAAAITAGTVMAAGPAPQDTRSLRGSIKIDGSSTVYPITEAVAEEFAEVAPRVRVTVGISGTGGGFKRFTLGETDISDASRPIKFKEYQETVRSGVEFIEIPVAYDGLSIVVNTENYFVESLTVDDLKKIFLDGSTVRTWSDVNPSWPNIPLKIYAPGTDSGTFDYFKEVVAGKTGSIRADMSVSEDDNVLVRGVSGDKGGIGFFGCAYYFENKDKLKVIPIVNPGTGVAVEPTAQSIESGDYAPFSRPLFIYVNKAAADRPEVEAFVDFFFTRGPELAQEVGYVKLPGDVTKKAMANFRNRATGSHYLTTAGHKVSGPVTKVYK